MASPLTIEIACWSCSGESDATGRRHFYIGSDVTGVRFNETRPATKDDRLRPTMRDY